MPKPLKSTLETTIEPDKVWITTSYTVQTRPYESFKAEAGRSISLTNKEDANEIIQETLETLTEIVIDHAESARNQ